MLEYFPQEYLGVIKRILVIMKFDAKKKSSDEEIFEIKKIIGGTLKDLLELPKKGRTIMIGIQIFKKLEVIVNEISNKNC